MVRVHAARADPVADPKPGRLLLLARSAGPPFGSAWRRHRPPSNPPDRFAARQVPCPASSSSSVARPCVDQQLLQASCPDLVVAGGKVFGRRQGFARKAGGVSSVQEPVAPMASVSAKARSSHPAWKFGSFSSSSIGPKPIWPPRSCAPFMLQRSSLIGSSGQAGADHAVAGDQLGELSSLQPSVPSRPFRDDQIADFRG